MPCGVLGTADIEINVTPIAVGFFAHEGMIVVGIHIAEVVGTTPSKARHCAEFVGVALGCMPVGCTAQRGLARLCGEEGIYLRELEGELIVGNKGWDSLLIIDGERLSPVALAAKDSIA